jgi:hypothetical protein
LNAVVDPPQVEVSDDVAELVEFGYVFVVVTIVPIGVDAEPR